MTSTSSQPPIMLKKTKGRLFILPQSEPLALVQQWLLLRSLLISFKPARSPSGAGDDVEVLVDIEELVGPLAVHVVVPLTDSSLLRVDRAVRAEERL